MPCLSNSLAYFRAITWQHSTYFGNIRSISRNRDDTVQVHVRVSNYHSPCLIIKDTKITSYSVICQFRPTRAVYIAWTVVRNSPGSSVKGMKMLHKTRKSLSHDIILYEAGILLLSVELFWQGRTRKGLKVNRSPNNVTKFKTKNTIWSPAP